MRPKVVTGIVVPAGGTIAQDIALAASAVQLAEISVSAEAERGTVNRALDEQRNATNIVSSVIAEQIAKSPDSDAGQAVQRVSGVTVQDGKYVFVRGLGERYTTTSLNGARIPSPEPERKVVPFDLFPSALAGGNHHLEDVHPRPAGRLQRRRCQRQNPGVSGPTRSDLLRFRRPQHCCYRKGSCGALTIVGEEWRGSAGAVRAYPGPAADVTSLAGFSQGEINGIIGSFRNAWSPQGRERCSANGSFGVTLGGEDPLFSQPIGYIGSFHLLQRPGNPVRTRPAR